jgi:hypothetical protein
MKTNFKPRKYNKVYHYFRNPDNTYTVYVRVGKEETHFGNFPTLRIAQIAVERMSETELKGF